MILFFPVIFAAFCCMFRSCVNTFYHDTHLIFLVADIDAFVFMYKCLDSCHILMCFAD